MAPSKPKAQGIPHDVTQSVKKLKTQQLNLQKQANKSQVQELGLLRQQTQAQNQQYEEQLSLFRTQIANSDQAASEYKAQMEMANQLQAQQVERQRLEDERLAMVGGDQNGLISSTMKRQTNQLNMRRQPGLQRAVGVLSSG